MRPYQMEGFRWLVVIKKLVLNILKIIILVYSLFMKMG